MSKKVALITGITGQDGSYLAELLLEKEYEVHGLVRRHSVDSGKYDRINHIKNELNLHVGDLLDESGIFSIIKTIRPNEVYSLAAQSHVGHSSNIPIFTTKVDAVGVVTLLEAIKQNQPGCKFYQASSSEMFGNSVDSDGFQRETTPMNPVSPYACAKLFSYHMTKHYRTAHNIFACNGILFNHESPRRGKEFVTQKIVTNAIKVYHNDSHRLPLGDLTPHRDWGHAKDYVYGMWLMMQAPTPDDFILASGRTHSVEEFCKRVFDKLGLYYKDYITYDPQFARPQELTYLKGDSTKAKTMLHWNPKYSFEDLIEDMVSTKLGQSVEILNNTEL
jgi:GDPmannose 4,6-dehydratase